MTTSVTILAAPLGATVQSSSGDDEGEHDNHAHRRARAEHRDQEWGRHEGEAETGTRRGAVSSRRSTASATNGPSSGS
jgi:Ni/Co efflux regulator RcnB